MASAWVKYIGTLCTPPRSEAFFLMASEDRLLLLEARLERAIERLAAGRIKLAARSLGLRLFSISTKEEDEAAWSRRLARKTSKVRKQNLNVGRLLRKLERASVRLTPVQAVLLPRIAQEVIPE